MFLLMLSKVKLLSNFLETPSDSCNAHFSSLTQQRGIFAPPIAALLLYILFLEYLIHGNETKRN